MSETKLGAIWFLYPLLLTILSASCLSGKQMDNAINRLYHNMPGKWLIERKYTFGETRLNRFSGLQQGTIIFYPNNRFMYRNKTQRLTGQWSIHPVSKKEHEYWILDVEVPEQEYIVYKITLLITEADTVTKEISADMFYLTSKKIKFKYESGVETVVNVLRRQ